MNENHNSYIIRNGRVVDPSNNLDCTIDVAIQDGVIKAVGSNLDCGTMEGYFEEFDGTGCLVTPGLIDLHVHVYEHATYLGANVDEFCLRRGVTTVVDAGSAGASTFQGLRKFIAERSKTRVLALLHIVLHGLASAGCVGVDDFGGELDSLKQANIDQCVHCINQNQDMIVGVKVRLGKLIALDGKNENEAYRRALEASQLARVPLMTHHAVSSIPVQPPEGFQGLSCPGDLKPGDIYTHCFNGLEGSIIDPDTQMVHPAVQDAKKRGVIFDIGHGVNSFTWTVAEVCGRQNFWPDSISTDMHVASTPGPAYDLPSVMTKMLNVGMPVYDVIKAVTSTPAKAIGWESKIGSLNVGNPADVTVLKIENMSVELEDSQAQLREITQRIVPVAVWKDGTKYDVTLPHPWPNHDILSERAQFWKELEVRDLTPPAQACAS